MHLLDTHSVNNAGKKDLQFSLNETVVLSQFKTVSRCAGPCLTFSQVVQKKKYFLKLLSSSGEAGSFSSSQVILRLLWICRIYKDMSPYSSFFTSLLVQP
jgi:hypothetical protein